MVKPYPMIAKPEQGLLVDIVKPAEFLSLFVDERNYLASEAGIISIKGYAVFRKDIIQRISLVDAEKGIVSSAEINLETDFMATRFPDEPGASKSGFLLTLQVEKIAEEGLGLVACAGDREFNIGTVRPFNAIPVGRTPYCSVVNFEGDGSIFMVCDSEDAIQGGYHGSGRFYEESLLKYTQDFVPKDTLILDIGANVGNHTVFYAKYYGAKEVIPFEPNPAAYQTLIENCRLNRLTNINLAYLGRVVSHLDLEYEISHNPEGNLGGVAYSPREGQGSPSISIDRIPIRDIVGLIKVDVEGMELDVLKSAKKLIQRDSPVIVVEVTDATAASCKEYLSSLHYRIDREYKMYIGIWTLVALKDC
ncbi:hypothetical protein GCM10007052_26220 [Halioglobus japonicus]|uniref:Methyltransferase FkbM domain-containing protein n=1 Tax=Halioglobus japonicus TaxID=930805 RepID=A0AAP8SLX4_9GAMM|nr:FkbM family methyltransferase [Halioglobus japonicus]PLW84944.1 hypothetical protein C0029_15485 [Halioglobus japonicus]GHD18649.1 hypothetical protein GCM10007052_26220 [Halioglobus japonicus]